MPTGRKANLKQSVTVWVCEFVTVGTLVKQYFYAAVFLSVAEVQFEGQLPSHGVRSYHGFVAIFASSFVCVLCSTAMILLGQL